MIARAIDAAIRFARGQLEVRDVDLAWEAWRADGRAPGPVDFDQLQEQLADELASHGTYTEDGGLVLHLELDADLVADIDKLRARFNFDNRNQVLQRGVELLKLLSTRSTYNAQTPAKIRNR